MRAALLAWYDAHKRDLPWRRTKDPYAIWVSEIMLQQTRVETVRSYWTRFLERFPDAASLASASEDEVLSMWSGLGYYRRARLLHRGVKEVVARYGGEVPRDAEARLGLPGVGRYTAGAIGSIAFGAEEPIVDGNVARVLSRLHRIEEPIGSAPAEKRFWAEASELVKGERPGDLNQALMELGATLCTPKSPQCLICPLRDDCEARAAGVQAELPTPRKKKPPKRVRLVAVVALRGGAPWLERSEEALFGGLWNVPMAKGEGRAAAREVLASRGWSGRLPTVPRGEVVHVLSHRRFEVQVWRATAARASEDARHATDLEALGISKLTRKLLSVAGVTGSPER